MKVLVTGGAGFIGSHIVDLLILEGFQVIVVDNLISGRKENINPKAVFYEADIRNQEIEKVFNIEKPDFVIHQAAQVSVKSSMADPLTDCSQNILATINILNASKNAGVKKIIFASSAAVYGIPEELPIKETHKLNPLSFYGLSKAVCEQYIQKYSQFYDLKYTILRYANVYGPRQSINGEAGVITSFINQVINKKPIILYGDGTQTRDFIYVKDVAQANIQALSKADHQILNISSNKEISLNQLIETISGHFKKEMEITHLSKREGDINRSCLANQKAIEGLGLNPSLHCKLEWGLSETLNYLSIKNSGL